MPTTKARISPARPHGRLISQAECVGCDRELISRCLCLLLLSSTTSSTGSTSSRSWCHPLVLCLQSRSSDSLSVDLHADWGGASDHLGPPELPGCDVSGRVQPGLLIFSALWHLPEISSCSFTSCVECFGRAAVRSHQDRNKSSICFSD